MSVKRIHPTSPVYPLPADYDDLTVEGQRQARVNGCSQWLLPGPISSKADCLVASTFFFDNYYLRPSETHQPGFYDMEPLTTPSYHWQLSRMWAHQRSAVVAPRGGAKTTHVARDSLLRLITCPRYSIVYATSTHENSRTFGQRAKEQCYSNPRINDDFSSEFREDRLRPARGDKMAATEHFQLTNGSSLRSISAQTRVRGVRPRKFRLDDPEYDEAGSTSMEQIRQFMERLLFKIAIPMTLRANCGIDWVGTFVSKRHYLWSAMQTKLAPDGTTIAEDPRFDLWERAHIVASWSDPATGRLKSCWPQMWPADAAERESLQLDPSTITLEEMERIMGRPAFNAEMQGNPGDADDLLFKRDPALQGRHSYWFENIDRFLDTAPCMSSTLICYIDTDNTITKMPLMEFLASCRTFITVDTAFSESSTSDRRVAHCMAVTPRNQLFSLDLWSDRKNDATLVKETFLLAQRWRTQHIFVEVVRESMKLYQRFQSVINTRMTENFNLDYMPGVLPLKPGSTPKSAKIAMLDTRFEHSLIKLPTWRRFSSNLGYTRLFEQIDSFNPEASNGGLANDDEIDTLAMSVYVLRGRVPFRSVSDAPLIDPASLISNGTFLMEGTNIPLAYGLPSLSPDLVEAARRATRSKNRESLI